MRRTSAGTVAGMNLAPLLSAPAAIQIHVAAALSAIGLGLVQLAAPKATIPHRVSGWAWTLLIGTAAISSFFIHTIRVWGPWSPLHLLAIFALAMLARAVIAARRHDAVRHRRAMLWMFGAGLVLPAMIAFAPGRIMYRVSFGAAEARAAGSVGYQYAKFPGPDGRAIELSIWYPSEAAPAPQPFGLFEQTVAKNGAVAGMALPLVVISHGTGGSFGGHYDTAQALARAGFVTAALSHPGDNFRDQSDSFTARNFIERPRQLSATIDYMLTAWSDRGHIDGARIGVFGHSAGGYTALASVGGLLDVARGVRFCREHPEDWGCEQARAKHVKFAPEEGKAPSWGADPRIKAIVAAAPAGGNLFAPGSLSRATVPVQLWEAQNEHFVSNGVIDPELPKPPELHVVPNAGHFDFLAPCSAALAGRVPEICESAPGFDRAAFHEKFNRKVAAFFAAALEVK